MPTIDHYTKGIAAMTLCFYVPGETSIIDTIDSSGLSFICKETLEQVQLRYPGAEVWDLDEACSQITNIQYKKYVQPPCKIDENRWNEMMNILPPMKWRGGFSTESFMVSEAFTADLHSIFCRIGNQYFEMCDSRSLSHEEIVARCQTLLNP